MSGRIEAAPTAAEQPEHAPLLGVTADQPIEEPVDSGNEYWDQFVATIRYAIPLVLMTSLQYSLRLTSLFFVGRLGTLELGATALAQVTTNITGFAALAGFATSLDTICPEAFAAGKPHLVGLYVQRTMYMLAIVSGLVAILWWFAEPLLGLVIPNERLVVMTASMIRVYIAVLPGYSFFEAGRRFIQAQGSATPIFYFLLLGVPLNVFLHWLFINIYEWGVNSTIVAVAITHTFLAVLMVIYICFSDAKKCWGGFTSRALHNWAPVLALAIPDLVMIEVDVLSWEVLSILSAYLSDEELAAQTTLISTMGIVFQLPFPFSIASSYQTATAIGKGDTRGARVSSIVSMASACVIGAFNLGAIIGFRGQIARLFTQDSKVLAFSTACMPLLAVVAAFDSISFIAGGVLRGLGRQKIGSIAMVIMYYAFGLPFSVGSAFSLHWRLHGLWTGILIAVVGTSAIDLIAILRLDLDKCVERSAHRTTHA